MKVVSASKAHGGIQGVYSHASETCACDMTFAVFVPPQAKDGRVPVLWYLSGLTCTHANVMDKGEYRRLAAELGLIDRLSGHQPARRNRAGREGQLAVRLGRRLLSRRHPGALRQKLPHVFLHDRGTAGTASREQFPADMSRQSIFGHSMGGHGALTIALKNPERFRSCSAFAPIVQPMTADWSRPALEKYLGADEESLARL